MFLFCVRVSSGEKVLYGPKWISIESDRTVRDILRTATGERFVKQKVKVLVASEESLKQLYAVKLEVPVTVLDKKDKKIVCFILQPDKDVATAKVRETSSLILGTIYLNKRNFRTRSILVLTY